MDPSWSISRRPDACRWTQICTSGSSRRNCADHFLKGCVTASAKNAPSFSSLITVEKPASPSATANEGMRLGEMRRPRRDQFVGQGDIARPYPCQPRPTALRASSLAAAGGGCRGKGKCEGMDRHATKELSPLRDSCGFSLSFSFFPLRNKHSE